MQSDLIGRVDPTLQVIEKLLFEMHLKQKGHLLIVLLIYTITTITLPVHSSTNSALHDERRSVLTTKGLRERINLDSKRGKDSRILPFLNSEIQNKTGFKLETNMAPSLIGNIFKDRNKPKRSDLRIKNVTKGKSSFSLRESFIFLDNLKQTRWWVTRQILLQGRSEVRSEVRGQRLSASKESWQKLKPVVDCGNDAMTLTVRRRRADGKHTLSLQIEENTFTVACPVSPPEELRPSHHPPHLQTGNIPESLESFPWAPPFYLAPLYYPHPTYHNYPPPDESSSTAELSLAPLPPVDSPPDDPHHIPAHFNIPTPQSSPENVENSHPVYPDPQETHVMGVSMKLRAAPSPVTVQDEAPSLQPSSHGFNSYYHYYHHPKIPLPDTTQDPDPGPEEPGKQSFTNSSKPGIPRERPLSSASDGGCFSANFHPSNICTSSSTSLSIPILLLPTHR
ncbi:hypothetical protein F7725_003871 [Dissostichus mawsoni]|uniref:Uncharacterized protein n=1 Tax=Dissostichus mawsoni TaxID=36200 RepID=A0A7J5YCD5_DISMA|nr:hypothetical protein F7725_003871 [Dissostichus mawsoni]